MPYNNSTDFGINDPYADTLYEMHLQNNSSIPQGITVWVDENLNEFTDESGNIFTFTL